MKVPAYSTATRRTLLAGALATSLQPPPLPSLAFASSEYVDALAGFALTVPAGLYAKQRGVRTKPDDTLWQAIDLPTGFVASVSLTEADTLLVEAGDPFAVGARFEAMGAIGKPTKVATLLSRRHFGDPAGVSELRSTLRSVVRDKEESLRFSNLVTVDVPASPTAAVASARTLEARTYFVAGSGQRRSYLLTAWVSSPLEVGRCERAPCDAEGKIRFDCPPPRCAASLADVPADPVAVAIVDSFRLTPNGDAARDEKLSRLGFFAEPQSPDAARSQFPSAALN